MFQSGACAFALASAYTTRYANQRKYRQLQRLDERSAHTLWPAAQTDEAADSAVAATQLVTMRALFCLVCATSRSPHPLLRASTFILSISTQPLSTLNQAHRTSSNASLIRTLLDTFVT